MHSKNSLEEKVTLSEQAKGAFNWQLRNLNMHNLKSLITPPAQLIISSDSSSQDWEASGQWQWTGKHWSREERKSHTNVLELKATKLGIMTLTMQQKSRILIHWRLDNIVTFSNPLKIGATKSQEMVLVGKKVWDYALSYNIFITSEYHPGVMNVKADWESRNLKEYSR